MTDPAHPAWLPSSSDELQDALDDGLLDERHHLELKSSVPDSKGERKETAKDLASLAVDGGRLIVGIDEGNSDEGRPPAPTPVPLDGLAERLEQVALTRVDPPLQLRFRRVPHDAPEGCLLVDVPASPQAPHMVDGRYWGRGDKTKHELSDGEVERLMRRRRAWEADIYRLLDEQMARDPIPADERTGPHLFIVARPVAARDNAVAHLFADQSYVQNLYQVLRDSPEAPRLRDMEFPLSHFTGRPRRRAEGGALCNDMTDSREPERRPDGSVRDDVFELELSEDGTLRLFTSAIHRNHPDWEGITVLSEMDILAMAHHVLACCTTVAAEASHYLNHDVGVALDGLQGIVGSRSYRSAPDEGTPYTQDRYRRVTRAAPAELTDRPGAVAERLLGPFVRSLNTAHLSDVASLLSDPANDSDDAP